MRCGEGSDPLQEGALLDDILGHARRVGGRHTQQTQRHSQGGSSGAACRCHYCSNVLLLLLFPLCLQCFKLTLLVGRQQEHPACKN